MKKESKTDEAIRTKTESMEPFYSHSMKFAQITGEATDPELYVVEYIYDKACTSPLSIEDLKEYLSHRCVRAIPASVASVPYAYVRLKSLKTGQVITSDKYNQAWVLPNIPFSIYQQVKTLRSQGMTDLALNVVFDMEYDPWQLTFSTDVILNREESISELLSDIEDPDVRYAMFYFLDPEIFEALDRDGEVRIPIPGVNGPEDSKIKEVEARISNVFREDAFFIWHDDEHELVINIYHY